MNEHFEAVGSHLATICHSDFEEAIVEAEVFDDYGNFTYSCRRDSQLIEGVPSNSEDHFAIVENLEAIKAGMGSSWNRCIFVLKADGSFQFDVSLIEDPHA